MFGSDFSGKLIGSGYPALSRHVVVFNLGPSVHYIKWFTETGIHNPDFTIEDASAHQLQYFVPKKNSKTISLYANQILC